MKKLLSVLTTVCLLLTMLAFVSLAAPSDYFEAGSGTADDPFVIANEDDFINFAESFYDDETYADAHIRLDADITTDYEYPIASTGVPFEGIFDGNGKTLTFTSEYFVGAFDEISGATVKNLTVVGDVSVKDGQHDTIGGIVGTATDNSVIGNCVFRGSVSNTNSGSNYFAGICAYASDGITIENCVNYADINSKGSYTAGILGYFTNGTVTVNDCFNYGDISGNMYIAGIIGNVYEAGADVNHCVNGGSITASLYAGGIMNFYAPNNTLGANITNCINRGAVTASANNGYSGGIVAFSVSYAANVKICNCANYGAVSGNSRKGGVLAYWSGRGRVSFVMQNCFNGGSVTGSYNGALIGYYDGNTVDDVSSNYYDSSKCSTPFYEKADVNPNAEAITGNDIATTAVGKLNANISSLGKVSTWLQWSVGYADNNGVAHKNSAGGYSAQAAFEQDLASEGSPNGAASVLSEGSLWIIIAIAVVAIGAVAALVIVRKKKTAAK
ncbi:MAG TPA: hypothetical protein DDY98_03305 [Ruminococcaceae bacterium]|nr:hypothetical protein [Oscillospiraceae bacterium]